jgi:serine/threonine protein phosphatase PrpC
MNLERIRKGHQVSESILTKKIKTLDSVQLWRTVSLLLMISYLAYCVKDKLCNDPNSGLFAVFDGHGGKQVADHVAERLPEEIRKEMIKNPTGDLSVAIEAVFLRV